MNSDREEGVVPGQRGNANPNVQNNQPNSQTDLKPGQPAQPTLELLYQLSETDRAAIMALPPGLRNPAVAALDKARVDFERGMQEKLELGRQAIANEKALFADPRFQEFMMGGDQRSRINNSAPPQQPPPKTDYGQLYGDEATKVDAVVGDIANRVKEALNIDGINDTLANLQRGMLSNQQEQGWENLVEYAKENDLPDPNGIKSQIYIMLRDNPNMQLDQAYTANVDLKSLITRPPITPSVNTEDDGGKQGEDGVGNGGLPVATQMPGTSKSSAVPDTKTEVTDPVEAAYARRAEGKVVDPQGGFKDAYKSAIDEYNEAHGTTFQPDDFRV